MRILVTGASGFIGGYVLRHFLEYGYKVTNFDAVKPRRTSGPFIQGSILDMNAVGKAVEKCDVVFHFAGFSNINLVKDSPRDCIDLNIMGTTNFLEMMRRKGGGRFIFASSVYAHDKQGHFYTTSKCAAEAICENYQDLYGLSVSVVRLGTVYGERSRHEDVVSIFSQRAVREGRIVVHGSGQQVRHFIHGEDIAAGCEKLLHTDGPAGTFEFSAKRGTSVQELAGIVKKFVPSLEIEQLNENGRDNDYLGNVGNGSLLQETCQKLKWEPSIDIEEGVRRLIKYFQRGK